MKKYIGIALIILAIALGFLVASKKRSAVQTVVTNPVVSQQITSTLPSGWSQIVDPTVDVKLEKKVDSGVKPQIVFMKSSSKDASDSAKYVDRLIAGARSAIPSLVITSTKRNSTESFYSTILTGYYFNQKQKISLSQRVYVKDDSVYTITGSYTGDLATEINQILDSIVKEKIRL